MADASQGLEEEIVLKLTTNFAKVLDSDTRKVGNFTKRVTNLFQVLGKDVSAVYKGMSKELDKGVREVTQEAKKHLQVDAHSARLKAGMPRRGISAVGAAESATMSKISGEGDFLVLSRTSAEKNKALEQQKNILEDIRKKAVELKKTGLVDVDKTLGGLNKSINAIKEAQKEIVETQKLTKNKPLISIAGDVDKQFDKFNALSSKISQKNKEINSYLGKENVGAYDVLEAKKQADQVKKINTEVLKVKQENIKKINSLEKESSRVQEELLRETNTKNRAFLESYYNDVRSKVTALERLNKSFDIFDLSKAEIKVRESARKLVEVTNNEFTKLGKGEQLKGIQQQYDKLNETYNKLADRRIISKGTFSNFSEGVKKLENDSDKYRRSLTALKQKFEEVQKLHRAGLAPPGTAKNLVDMKNKMSMFTQELHKVNTGLQKTKNRMEALQQKSSRSIFGATLKSLRNIRWQIATFVYLIGKAVAFVNRSIIKALDEVQKYHTDAMSIAASTAYSLVGDTKKAFQRAYKYSLDLMVKLELTAAKTVLTLEDMLMLTKTFSQAGLVPRTDEDVKKIATIGTAIRTLTEGMANAGVQMRQELYAVIQGRQRPTDQLAVMFKMVGLDIQKIIKDAQMEGETLLDALASSLEPFAEVNKELSKQYGAQKNQLEIIWQKIKRIGTEKTWERMGKQLEKLNALFYSLEGNLTDTGLKIANIVNIFMSEMSVLGQLLLSTVGSFYNIGESTKVWAKILEGINYLLAGALHLVDRFISAFMAGIKVVEAGYYFVRGLFKTELQMIRKEHDDLMSYIGDGLDELSNIKVSVDTEETKKSLGKSWDNAKKAFEVALVEPSERLLTNIKAISEASDDMASGVRKGLQDSDLGTVLSIPNFNIDYDRIEREWDKAKQQVSEGVGQIELEFKVDTGKLEQTKTQLEVILGILRKGLKEQTEIMSKLEKPIPHPLYGLAASVKSDEYKDKELGIAKILLQLEVYASWLTKVKNLEQAYEDRRVKKLNELREKFESFILSVRSSDTALEKNDKKWEKNFKTLEKYRRTLSMLPKEYESWKKVLEEEKEKDKQNIIDDFDEKLRRLGEGFESHKVLSPLKAIDNEFAKLIIKADELARQFRDVDGAAAKVEGYKKQAEEARKARKELALLDLQMKTQEMGFESQELLAKQYSLSASSADKVKGAVIRLNAEYEKNIQTIKNRIAEIKKVSSNAEDSQEIEKYREQLGHLNNQLLRTKNIYERELAEASEPMWAAMKSEMEGYSDTWSSALTDMAWDYKNWASIVVDVTNDMTKQIVKILIKNLITNKVADIFSSLLGFGVSGGGGGSFRGADAYSFTAPQNSIGGGTGGLTPTIALAEGGWITEPVIGQGLRSGKTYNIGEGGENELVVPESKLGRVSGGNTFNIEIHNSDEKGVRNALPELRRMILEVVEGDVASGGSVNRAIKAYAT